MTILINFLLVIEAIVALLMMLVILMQRPKSEGLGAAFGGGVTENIFGAQTTTVLTTITTWLASIFFVLVLGSLDSLRASRRARLSGAAGIDENIGGAESGCSPVHQRLRPRTQRLMRRRR